MRSKIFRQVVQKNRRLADARQEIFVQLDGIRFKQGVRRDLCGIALNNPFPLSCQRRGIFVLATQYPTTPAASELNKTGKKRTIENTLLW